MSFAFKFISLPIQNVLRFEIVDMLKIVNFYVGVKLDDQICIDGRAAQCLHYVNFIADVKQRIRTAIENAGSNETK